MACTVRVSFRENLKILRFISDVVMAHLHQMPIEVPPPLPPPGLCLNLNQMEGNKFDSSNATTDSQAITTTDIPYTSIDKRNSIYNVHDIIGVRYLSKLRLQFSALNEHKFRHNFD